MNKILIKLESCTMALLSVLMSMIQAIIIWLKTILKSLTKSYKIESQEECHQSIRQSNNGLCGPSDVTSCLLGVNALIFYCHVLHGVRTRFRTCDV